MVDGGHSVISGNSRMSGTSRTGSLMSVFSNNSNRNNGPRRTRVSSNSGNASKSTGSSSGKSTSSHIPVNIKRKRSINFGRIALVVVLIGIAVGFGYGSYVLMENAGNRVARERFESIAERAGANAKWVLAEKKQATDALALMYGSVNPNASEWPYVYMNDFDKIASSLKLITKGSMSYCPIVTGYGEELKAFEDYYYNLWDSWGYPNTTGVSAFGKGIFGYGWDAVNNKLWPDYKYPVLSNESSHGFPNPDNITVPFVQSDIGNHPSLMLDVMFHEYRAQTVHDIMRCSEVRQTAKNESLDCGSITDMIWQATQASDVAAGPSGMLFSPIYPRNDPLSITGFILHKQIWHDLLKHAFEIDVSGIRIVLHTDSGNEHSYDVNSGEVTYVGNRTHHCLKNATGEENFHLEEGDPDECKVDDPWIPFDDIKYLLDEKITFFRKMNLPITEGIFVNENTEYYMDIYATDEFISTFGRSTDDGIRLSTMTCIITVMVIIFTSVLFVAYDYCVRKEFDSKDRLLEAKRRFVRFVSHEVRTPLNTVCMGLTLLQNDLANALGDADHSIISNQSGQKLNHHEKFVAASNNSNGNVVVSDNELVMKRDVVEEMMSLSTQVFQNADAAVGVLSDLLNYDKIQMGTLTLELSLINLWVALEKTVEEFRMSAKEKLVDLKMDFSQIMNPDMSGNAEESYKESSQPLHSADLPSKIRNCKVVGDKIRLVQVFRNLISNGLKFSKEYSSLTVRVSFDPLPDRKQKPETIKLHKDIPAEVTRRGTVTIDFIDEGVGMTPEQVNTVFEDGTQFDANKLQAGGGSGLGLNIARGIVLEHGGTLSCSSLGLGKGSTFTLTTSLFSENCLVLSTPSPTNGVPAIEEETPDEENALESTEFSIPLFRILVVDDSVTNRKLCQRLLERSGHTTEGACDGREAVNMVKSSMKTGNLFDCILLDYEMPVMNGPEACQLIRKMGCNSYIAGVTGNVMSEDVDHFRNCGANWVLPKPFRLKALEDQWIEDGVTPYTQAEKNNGNMIRVESSHGLLQMGDGLAVAFESNVKPPQN